MEGVRIEIAKSIETAVGLLKGRAPLVDASALTRLAKDLKSHPGAQGVLVRLQDPAWLGKLVVYAPVRRAGAAYIVPGLLAWTVLAVAEFAFSKTDDEQASFFTWWSRQALFSPMTYSAGVAVCLAWLVGSEMLSGYQLRRQHRDSAIIDEAATKIAVLATVNASTPSNDMAVAAEQFTSAAGALDDLVSRFERAQLGIQQTQDATARAIEAARSIEVASAALALPADRLASSLEGLKPLLASWTATREEVSGVVARIESSGTQVEAALDQLRALARDMITSSQQNAVTVARLHEMVTSAESSQPAIQASAESLRKAGQSLEKSQALLASMVREAAILLGIADGSTNQSRG